MYNSIIIIPYRNRQKHLDYFLEHTIPLIENYMPNSKVIVVEQSEGKLFNRGKLINVGFKEYTGKTKYFFTHDVDINPTIKCIEKYYTKDVDDNNILGIYTSIHNTLGGIIKGKDEVFQKINGFPNDVWGWGAEDKALQNRAEYYNINKITNLKNDKKYPLYFLRFDDIKDQNLINHPKNRHQHYVLFNRYNDKQKKDNILSSGLNNIQYEILERKNIHNIVEIIKVKI